MATTMNSVTLFVRDLLERATKTGAQAAVLSLGAQNVSHLDALSVQWMPVLSFAAGGFILSILTSIASQPIGDKASASTLNTGRDMTSLPVTSAPGPVDPVDAVSKAAEIFPLD